MKKTLLLTVLVLALALTGSAGAQMMESEPGMMHGEGQAQMEQAPGDMSDMMYPGMMGGFGMGPGMMMGGCGMGPGMMDGYGMGPGMMGNYGYGMGPKMMGGRHGCGQHMRSDCYGYGRSQEDHEKFRKVMDETREMRKKLVLLQFDYREMLRNPDTTLKEKMEMERKMFELQQQIQEKMGQ